MVPELLILSEPHKEFDLGEGKLQYIRCECSNAMDNVKSIKLV